MGRIGKQPEKFQKKGTGLSPSGTSTHDPLNNYLAAIVDPAGEGLDTVGALDHSEAGLGE
jgi:hypothetical protein